MGELIVAGRKDPVKPLQRRQGRQRGSGVVCAFGKNDCFDGARRVSDLRSVWRPESDIVTIAAMDGLTGERRQDRLQQLPAAALEDQRTWHGNDCETCAIKHHDIIGHVADTGSAEQECGEGGFARSRRARQQHARLVAGNRGSVDRHHPVDSLVAVHQDVG